jgi:hypothetical protein
MLSDCDEFKRDTLCFGSHQDALDFASQSAEHSNRVLASNNLVNVVERYREGNVCIVGDLASPDVEINGISFFSRFQ